MMFVTPAGALVRRSEMPSRGSIAMSTRTHRRCVCSSHYMARLHSCRYRAPRSAAPLIYLAMAISLGLSAASAPPLLCENPSSRSLLARSNDESACPKSHPRPWRGAAVNIFDSFWVSSTGQQTCCNATGGPTTKADAIDALRLAAANGVRVFRFFANLWGPNCAFVVEQPRTFWREMDLWWDEVDRLGLFAIPSLGAHDWHYATQNETINDLVLNRNSKSRKYAVDYVRTFTTRYSNRSSLFFWELGNELNLLVDLPRPHCHPTQQCFNTQSMVDFQDALARAIRAAEMHPASKNPYGPRPISSGFSAPRPSAWHQAHFMPHDPRYWNIDSLPQWLDMLQMQNAESIDIWSMHMYDNEQGSRNISMLSAAVFRARAQGKMLFLGEYGGNSPNYTGPTPSSRRFPQKCLDTQVEDAKNGIGGLALSAIWAWACPSHRRDMVCIWPGEPDGQKETGTNATLAMLANANRQLAVQI